VKILFNKHSGASFEVNGDKNIYICKSNKTIIKRNAYRILVGKPEGKRLLGRKDVGGWTILKWIL
jgi:hypothetical protein